ncbi:MAG: Membrane-associated phospholipid phosphatase [uncultured Sulfurovum sp.]|uniref:Membrane-associated phospholipid phosphatase n=1 Tax=uncultured Sulfurovum sp. TaxID=269237 RepID=A0A6S6SF17_9BACT|nr:MAG: Membrane-associated phospholipid phosphatase [uncultured Sulfurovum sp.]
MYKFIILLSITILSNPLQAQSNTKLLSDALALSIPMLSYGATLYNEDKQGQEEFYYAYGTTVLLTSTLKYSIDKKRPDNNGNDSFPSGHTSSAFTGATFIHKKYGFKYAVLPYVGAIYTAYSRVHLKRHDNLDVLTGALIGIGSAWYFTSPYKKVQVQPVIQSNYTGLKVAYQW